MENISKRRFLNCLSDADIERLVKKVTGRTDILRITIDRNYCGLDKYQIEATLTDYNWPIVLTLTDTLAHCFLNFQGHIDYSNRLIDFMCKQKNGASYAKMLFEKDMSNATIDYQRRMEIFNSRNLEK